jgi:hypothetical protein
MRDEGSQPRYAYPGREVSYRDGKTLLYEARTFIGNCLPRYDNAVVWYERGRTKTGGWQEDVFVAAVRQDALREIQSRKANPHCIEEPRTGYGWAVSRTARGQSRERAMRQHFDHHLTARWSGRASRPAQRDC